MQIRYTLVFLLWGFNFLNAQKGSMKPVTPNASTEAVSLLEYIYEISGQVTLSGQHCAPIRGSSRLSVVHRLTGKYPAVFGQDFGFSYPGYWDGINFRQQIVDEAIQRHRDGFIITLMWHAVPPTMEEPVSFEEGIKHRLSKEEWQALVTPGTELNERWKAQVDVIAWFLKQLKYAKVPVLWRPYHEMNGGWFWWGKQKGPEGYTKLYRMLFDRFVTFHGLDNLIWVYNTNEVKLGVDRHDAYYPGADVVDIIATDVYKTGYNKENYRQLKALAGTKPIALGEVGLPPGKDILKKQPDWSWFMMWHDPVMDKKGLFKGAFNNPQVYSLKDLPWTDFEKIRMHYPYIKN